MGVGVGCRGEGGTVVFQLMYTRPADRSTQQELALSYTSLCDAHLVCTCACFWLNKEKKENKCRQISMHFAVFLTRIREETDIIH